MDRTGTSVRRSAVGDDGRPASQPDAEVRLLRRLAHARAEERRRLERDLHDGAQQELLAVRVGLDLAAREAAGRPDLVERLERLVAQLDAALDRIRDLARGAFPPLLDQAGLAGALAAAGRGMGPDVRVSCDEVGRYPVEVEAAVYFSCLEAAQNALKHAGPGAAISIELSERDGGLGFEVRDDGAGFDPDRARPGQGMSNMTERLAELGGTIEVSSRPGAGTRVAGVVPLAPSG